MKRSRWPGRFRPTSSRLPQVERAASTSARTTSRRSTGANTHERYSLCQRALFLSRRLDRFVRVLHQALRAADGARDVEAPVEVAEILRSLEGFLERRLREAQGGAKPLKLTLIDLPRRHWSQMLTSVR